jgi:hypothetical protein
MIQHHTESVMVNRLAKIVDGRHTGVFRYRLAVC